MINKFKLWFNDLIEPTYNIDFTLLSNNAKKPTRNYEWDACYDLYAADNYVILGVNNPSNLPNRVKIKTDVAMAIPKKHAGFIWDRSGLSTRNGLHVLAGVIDSTYRGGIIVALINLSTVDYSVEKGEKIAQIAIQRVSKNVLFQVSELEKSERNNKGFGSSGRF